MSEDLPGMTCELRTHHGWVHVEVFGSIYATHCIAVLGNATHSAHLFRDILRAAADVRYAQSVCFVVYDYTHARMAVDGLESYAVQLETVLRDVTQSKTFSAICVGFGTSVAMQYVGGKTRQCPLASVYCVFPDPVQYLPTADFGPLLPCCRRPRRGVMTSVHLPPVLCRNVHIDVLRLWRTFAVDDDDCKTRWTVVEDPRIAKTGRDSAKKLGAGYMAVISNSTTGMSVSLFSLLVEGIVTCPES